MRGERKGGGGRRKGRKMWRGNRRKKAATDYPLGRAAGLSKFIDRQRDFDRIDVRGICRKMGRRYRAFSSLFPTPPSPEVYCLRGEVDHGEMIGSTIREGGIRQSFKLPSRFLLFPISIPFIVVVSLPKASFALSRRRNGRRRRIALYSGGEDEAMFFH